MVSEKQCNINKLLVKSSLVTEWEEIWKRSELELSA